MKTKIILILIIFLSPLCGIYASPVVEADSAYTAKEYEKAVGLYKTVLEEQGSSPELLFNLGNAYFQLGDYGNAMICWQRAHRLDPSQKEINANIRYLESRVDDANKAELKGKRIRVTPDEPSFFQSMHKSIALDIASDRWAVWGAVAFLLFVIALALYIFSRDVLLRKIGFFGGSICLLISVVFVSFAIMGAKAFESSDTGVITAFKTELLTEPGKGSDSESASGKSGVLTKGTQVQILSEEVDAEGNVSWYKVRLNSDFIGWVPAASLTII